MENAKIPILIPAAGASGRMRGPDKLLLTIGNEPLLRRVVRQAIASGAPVFVMLDPARPRRQQALAGLDVHLCPVPEAPHGGLSASLRAGIRASRTGFPQVPGALIVLADMPLITPEDMIRLLREARALPDRPLRAADENGKPGHPVYLPRRLLEALEALHGDRGAGQLLEAEAPRLIELPPGHAGCDLDNPEDWERFLEEYPARRAPET